MISDLIHDPDFHSSCFIFGLAIVLCVMSRIDAYRMDRDYKRMLQQCKYGKVEIMRDCKNVQ